MLRTVTSHLSMQVHAPATLVLPVSAAQGTPDIDEVLTVTRNGAPLHAVEVLGPHGTRLHRVLSQPGRVAVDNRAAVTGRDTAPEVREADLIAFLRPSRYAESDKLLAFAGDQFRGLADHALVDAVVGWVHGHLVYLSGSSVTTDGATDTLLKRRGVCRDFAHLVVALLRIATGRDATGTAFLSTYRGDVTLTSLSVTATVDGDLPRDDGKALLALG